MAEDELIGWLRGRLGSDNRLGDDAALVPTGDTDTWAVTVDTQIEGVHFFPGTEPEAVARRLLAVNLSDLAAMGADPGWCLLALAASSDFDHRRFFDTFLEVADAYGVELVGGDLAGSPTTTAVLTLAGRRSGRRFVERRGARPGHVLWLGGPVADASIGLALRSRGLGPDDLPEALRQAARRALDRHASPRPQLELGRWLADQPEGGALDVSDGVAKDLARLCAESGVGAEVDEAALPISTEVVALAEHLGLDPVERALGGGEDYVLLFTLPEGETPPEHFGARPIGRIVVGDERVLVAPNGDRRPLPAAGFDHLSR